MLTLWLLSGVIGKQEPARPASGTGGASYIPPRSRAKDLEDRRKREAEEDQALADVLSGAFRKAHGIEEPAPPEAPIAPVATANQQVELIDQDEEDALLLLAMAA